MFRERHINRRLFPTKHVLVCEDNLDCQARLARHLIDVFGHDGEVQVSLVSGAMAGAVVMSLGTPRVDLVILDRDMPHGNGDDLLEWMRETNQPPIPVITFSGIPANNDALMAQGARYRFEKEQVIAGAADWLIKQILGVQ